MIDNTHPWSKLHSLFSSGLSTFLNGLRLGRLSYLLYPFVDQLDQRFWAAWLSSVREPYYALPQEDLVFPFAFQTSSPATPHVGDAARWLSWLGSFLVASVPKGLPLHDRTQRVACLKAFDTADYDNAYLAPISSLQRFASSAMAHLVVGIYLHGSMSTLDYVEGSSDVDVVVVVKETTIADPDELLSLRRHMLHALRWFYRIDYSQHHRYAVLSELDLRLYSDSMFPRILFSYATPLVGPMVLPLRFRRAFADRSESLRNTARYVRGAVGSVDEEGDWFALKLLLQSVLLVPTLYLSAQATPVYKRDSFSLAQSDFSPAAWRIVQKASRIRDIGVQGALLSPRVDDLISQLPNPWIGSLIHRKLRNQVPAPVPAILGDNWRSEAVQLVDEAERRLSLGR